MKSPKRLTNVSVLLETLPIGKFQGKSSYKKWNTEEKLLKDSWSSDEESLEDMQYLTEDSLY